MKKTVAWRKMVRDVLECPNSTKVVGQSTLRYTHPKADGDQFHFHSSPKEDWQIANNEGEPLFRSKCYPLYENVNKYGPCRYLGRERD